jgi:uncharacterized protein YndB with AHSA1/START domain
MAAIETDTFLPHPPAAVWRALTDPDLLGRWLMPNDFEARIGHRFTFRTEPVPGAGFDGNVHCEVLDLQPEAVLTISWRSGPGLDTTVTWRLVPEGRGTRLFLTHDGFDESDPGQRMVMGILGGGWIGPLRERLEAVLGEIPRG